MSRASITKAHHKIQELSWEPTFVEPVDKYPTDYTFEKAPKKDPLKQVLRSYFPMEEEKDNRVFGAMDGAIRGNMFRQVQQRWMEWQKLFLSIIPFPEISAARAMPLAINAVPEPRGPQRARHPDDRRGSSLDDPDEPQAAVHEPLHRSGRVRHHREGVRELLRRHDRPPVRRGVHHRRRDHRRQRLPDDRRRDGVHERPLRRDAGRGRGQRRLPAADRVPLGAVRRVAATSPTATRSSSWRSPTSATASCSSATCATRGGTTTRSWTPRSARSSSTAPRTAARTASPTRRPGAAGSTTTTTGRYLVPLEKYGLTIPHDLVEEAWNRIWNKGYIHEVAQFFATGWFANYWRIDGDGRRRLRVVRAQVPGLVRQVRQVVGELRASSRRRTATSRSPSRPRPTTSIRTAAGPAWSRA